MSYIIAIDGPSSSGKSTISKILSKKFNLFFISSGKYYRCLTYLYNHGNFNRVDEKFIDEARSSKITITDDKVFLNDIDVTNEITDDMISNNISLISNDKNIREIVNDKIRFFAKDNDVIMDGRDIGTVVFPNANLKIYLTASSVVRSKRRKLELENLNKNVSFISIWLSIIRRDYKDKHRKVAPLKKAKDSIVISSTKYSINEIVEKISHFIER